MCFQVVAVALPSEKSMETLFGSELTFSCNKELIVSIVIKNSWKLHLHAVFHCHLSDVQFDCKFAHVLLIDFQGDILINGNNARIVARNMLFDSGIAHGIDQLLEPPGIGARCDNFTSIEVKVQIF